MLPPRDSSESEMTAAWPAAQWTEEMSHVVSSALATEVLRIYMHCAARDVTRVSLHMLRRDHGTDTPTFALVPTTAAPHL